MSAPSQLLPSQWLLPSGGARRAGCCGHGPGMRGAWPAPSVVLGVHPRKQQIPLSLFWEICLGISHYIV